MSRARTCVLALVPSVLLAGCTSAAPTMPPSSTTTPSATSVPLATSTWSPGPSASYMGLGLVGSLAVDPTGCWYVTSDDGWRYTLLWPQGFSAERRSTGLVVLDGRHSVVARPGDRVRLWGGVTTTSANPGACDPASRDFYEINADLRPEA